MLSHTDAAPIIYGKNVLVCHAPYTKNRLGYDEFYCFDVLELFAFVHPAKFCVPTPVGLARALGLSVPETFEDSPIVLIEITRALLTDLQKDTTRHCEQSEAIQSPIDRRATLAMTKILEIAAIMGRKGKGWAWTPFIFSALGEEYDPSEEMLSRRALNVWKHLPEWAEDAPEPPASHHGVSEDEAHAKLEELLNVGDKHSEARPQQKSYAAEIAKMFEPMREDEAPHIVLAEAQTGVGKTLGYLAPASVWADKNEGSVWISTYTKNLQRQIDGELDRLYPHEQVKNAYVAIRKGRENYLCLLNFEDLAAGASLSHNPRHAIAAGIMARWIAACKDGDLSGAQFSGWLGGLLGFANSSGLADKRGECVFSSCDHYKRCFVERSIRKAKHARIIIANHALVMINAAMSNPSELMPTRYIFDEGHHLFSAADSAFSSHLTARESAELRRWILGNEGNNKGRARGLKRRVEDLVEGEEEANQALQDILHRANCLCAQNWSRRFKDNAPYGAAENFLMQVHRIIYARAQNTDSPYSIETELHPADDELLEAAKKLKGDLIALLKPMDKLVKLLRKRLADDKGEMESDMRRRIDAICSSLERRGSMTLKSWIAMLETLETGEQTEGFVDWMEIERIDGKSRDVGIYRHYIDPMQPFAASIAPHLHGMSVTSATLCDSTDNEELNWQSAVERSGAGFLTAKPEQSSYGSPFNYAQNAKVIIINDVNKNSLDQVAAAYQALFTASGGGALGLFTAVNRLKAIHSRIALPLEDAGLHLYGQHMDDMDTGTLIDIFRDDVNSCLLGTDAVRDGVDVPGNSLRLLVFDRVPWSRPSILHKARCAEFGKQRYNDMLTRLKLKQAFGRLIRRADDKGIFVMLDSMLPSRLHGAFPEECEIMKLGLSDAVAEIKGFY